MKANSAKAKHLAQTGWSKNSIEHLKAELRIKNKQPKVNISQSVKTANQKPQQPPANNVIKAVDYKKHRINPNLYEFRQWLHKPEYRFLILDLEFYITGNKGVTKETTHVLQIAGQVFNDFDRFNQIKEELNLGFPETGNISYVTDGSDCEYFAMVKFDDREEIERIVNSFPFVEESVFYFEDEIPAYYSSVTSDYDRFLIFDRELGMFNTYVNGDSFYYLAYEDDSNILVVCEFKGDEALNG